MKTTILKILTITILFLSALSYSQDLQPKKIQFNGHEGVFLSIELMDSVVFKLIDRKTLLSENKSLTELYIASKEKSFEYEKTINLLEKSIANLKSINNLTIIQRDKFKENFEIQESITKDIKRQSRKNGIVLFGSGIAVGVVIFAVFL